MQSPIDVVAAVQVRIEDQPLPAHRGARLFKIGAHDYLKAVFIGGGESCQPSGIVQGRDGIMDGAGANHDQQAIVFTCQIRRA
jgi:cobaltochelatase CobN